MPQDLPTALGRYRQNLIALVEEAARLDVRLVFVTQPAVWSPALPEVFWHNLWLMYKGSRDTPYGRYSPAISADLMTAYNGVVLDVCQAYTLVCVDASALNGEVAYFYDDVHLNSAGSHALAAVIWQTLEPVLATEKAG
ncbi:MAG: hypothetical protein HC915_01375 [Anaerolineae bacterium]|nr:hypothetical protein [Anaerolineae bacterium]